MDDIILVRQVVGSLDEVDLVKIVRDTVDDLVLSPAVPDSLNAGVSPELLDGVA